jgi:uncharacterized protein (TIGR02453 family)
MADYNLKSTLVFLSDLESNNNRPWFEEHKGRYNEARAAFEGLVDELIQRCSAYEDLSGVTAKTSVMRIYRDIRFSRDKTPYNAWMAAHITPGGKKSGQCGFGLRLASGNSGAAGGLWSPSPDQLARFRRTLDQDEEAFLDLIHAPDFVHHFGNLQGEMLKTVPKGFPKDHSAAEFLKLKQVYALRPFWDEAVLADDFADQLVAAFLAMKPFLNYINGVIS